ncbi:MAG: CPBP family intramembrane glutamic endopeptidase [Thermodesulfobacteriota bacterium]|nr:CPBP family intramembrane glutamic endopeptidase [Thermodesulfobacteriota bacterium]
MAGTVLLAAVLWFVTFYLTWASFWIKISLSAAALAILSLLLQPSPKRRIRIDVRAVILGLVSAAILYLIFWTGKAVASVILPFSVEQIGGIYHKGAGTPMWVIALLLFLVTGPSEELYWRGYLQKNLMLRFGQWQGWLLATAVYAGVHIWSFNFMLIGAAAVAGAFWGAMYWRLKNLGPVVISHSVWSVVIFAVFPMH